MQTIHRQLKLHFDTPGAPKYESLDQLAQGMNASRASKFFYQTLGKFFLSGYECFIVLLCLSIFLFLTISIVILLSFANNCLQEKVDYLARSKDNQVILKFLTLTFFIVNENLGNQGQHFQKLIKHMIYK